MPELEDRFAEAARLWRQGKLEQAVAIYDRLLQNEAISAMARGILCEYLGRLHAGLGDLAAAEKYLRRAVVFAPDVVDHQVQLANCLCLLDREEEAWQLISRLYRRHSEHPAVIHYMGKMLDERGQHKKGLALMKKAVRFDPNNERLLVDLVFAYLRRGDAGAAMVCSEQALALNPEDEVVQFVHELARAFEEHGNLQNSPPAKRAARKKSPVRKLKREAK